MGVEAREWRALWRLWRANVRMNRARVLKFLDTESSTGNLLNALNIFSSFDRATYLL
jgi:hypothetical protein